MCGWKAKVNVNGVSPLLMNGGSVGWRDRVAAWRTKPGRDLLARNTMLMPAWMWLGDCYQDKERFCIPSDNVLHFLREGGKRVHVPGGGSNQSFKHIVMGGLICTELTWPLLTGGKEVPWAPFEALMDEEDYEVHKQTALDNGFYLFEKTLKVGVSKHIRVRPRFDEWSFSFEVEVLDDMITLEIFEEILKMSGEQGGIGDWRPSSPQAPGPFGRFESELEVA